MSDLQPTTTEVPRWLNQTEIADYLGMSRRQLWLLREEGSFPDPTGGGPRSARWEAADIVAWERAGRPSARRFAKMKAAGNLPE